MTYIRNNTDIVRQAAVDKQLDPAIIDQLLEVDKKRRELQAKVDAVRQQSNDNAKIKALVQAGKTPPRT